MISRVVVPTNARIDANVLQMPNSILKAHLVARRLIPADAKLSATPETERAPDRDKRHETMVRKLLVPAGARIGNVAVPSALNGQLSRRRHRLLDEALLNKAALGRNSSVADWLISVGIHAAIVATVLVLPLYFTQAIDLHQLELTYLVAPPLPPAPAPTQPPSVAAGQPAEQIHRVFTSHGKLFMPPAIPKQIAMLKEAPLPPEPESGGVFGGVPGGVTGGVIGGMLEGFKAPEAPPPPPSVPAVAKVRAPVPVGGNVQPPRIILQVNPDYPLLAQHAGIQGEVIISAVIDAQGNVVEMKVVSGHPLLYEAAMKALAKWKFEPTYLNGEPVAVTWNASVKFRMA